MYYQYIFYMVRNGLVQEALQELKLAGLPPTAVDFNFDVFLAKDTTATKIADAARMLPAFALVEWSSKDADKLKADTLNDLQTYLDDPSRRRLLFLWA